MVVATGPALILAVGALDKERARPVALTSRRIICMCTELVVPPAVDTPRVRGHERDDAVHDSGQDDRAGSARAGLHPPKP